MSKEKQLLLDELKDQINHYGSFVVMKYSSFTANKANEFRNQVAQLGGSVEMMRKRMLIKAAQEAGVELKLADLPGHIALVFAGKDALETAKFVFKFGQENDKMIEVVGGRVDGQLYNAKQIDTLSKLPGKDQMRAELLGLFEAPMAQTLSVMEAIMASVVYCLDNKCKKENSET